MNEIQIFSNPTFGEIRTQMSASGEPLFCASDVCSALGYSNGRDAIAKHVDNPDVAKRDIGVVTGKKADGSDAVQIVPMLFVNESGLYSLIFGSKLDSAKAFKRWVTSEVLPSIRKQGSYSMPQRQQQLALKDKLSWVKEVKKLLNLNENSTLSLLQQVGEPLGLPLPDYTPSKGILKSATELLKENGSSLSIREFNALMIQHGYLADMTRKAAHGQTKHFKTLTAKAKQFGENQVSPKAPNQTQPMYYADNFASLLKTMEGGAI